MMVASGPRAASAPAAPACLASVRRASGEFSCTRAIAVPFVNVRPLSANAAGENESFTPSASERVTAAAADAFHGSR